MHASEQVSNWQTDTRIPHRRAAAPETMQSTSAIRPAQMTGPRLVKAAMTGGARTQA